MMRPLDGMTIVDFSRVLAGPMATQILCDAGARVIKVERPGQGDESRSFAPFFADGQSAYYAAFNRGKSSIAIDLGQPEGQKIALELAAKADIVVENFLPGTMDRMGIGYDAVKARNPGVIYVSNTGFGQVGPYSDRKGYDTVFQALSGVVDLTGYPEAAPAKVGVPFADMTSGLWIALSAMIGLTGRMLRGEGCHVDLSMMDVQVSLLSLPAAWYFAEGITPKRTGTEHLGRVPSAAFECTGGQWIFISASDQHWPALVKVLGLAVPDAWAKMGTRVAERKALMEQMRAAIIGRDRAELAEALRLGDVPVGEVNTVPEILNDPHTRARGIVGSFDDPLRGATPALGTPGRYSGFDTPQFTAPPALGEQTDAILAQLGLDSAEIDSLKQKGTVA
jgi:crotonobetainyl-CoA:carnitine CoA-transferase CaiB-like acyl-CoA transferase